MNSHKKLEQLKRSIAALPELLPDVFVVSGEEEHQGSLIQRHITDEIDRESRDRIFRLSIEETIS
jgi:hypothetical protein